MAAMKKLILPKLVRTIDANAVRGRSYEISLHENLSYESFFTRKFPDLRYMYTHSNYEFVYIYTNHAHNRFTMHQFFMV